MSQTTTSNEADRRYDFDRLYEQHRAPLYRALVVATDDRDLSLEAVDAAFAHYRRRFRRGATDDAPEEIMRSALRHIGRRERRRQFSGFRLPDTSPTESTAMVVSAIRRLDPADRLVLVGAFHLGWPDERIARSLGRFPADVTQRRASATARVLEAVGSHDEDTIRTAVEEAVAGMSLPLSRLESVKADARLGRVGVVVGALLGALALGAVGIAGVQALLDETDHGVLAATGSGDPPQVDRSGFANVEWVRGELPFREGDLSAVTAGPEGFIGIGIDWSGADGGVPRAMSSPDGVAWSVNGPLGAVGQGGGGWVAGLTYDGERYLAVGSRFDGVMGRETPVLYTSEDGGTWVPIDLPVESSLEIEGFQMNLYTSPSGVFGSGDSITVFGTQHGDGDFEGILNEVMPDDVSTNFGWGFGADGIEVYDSNGEVVFRATAEELGVPEEVWAVMHSGRPVVWRSSDDGATWKTGNVGGGLGEQGWLSYVTANDVATVAVVGGQFGGELRRIDGDRWQTVDLGRGTLVNGVGQHDGVLYAAGLLETGRGAVWTSTDGTEWTVIDDAAFEGLSFDRIVGSPYGLVAVGPATAGQPLGPAILSEGDLDIVISANGLYTVIDADGEVVVEVYDNELDRTGGSIEIADPESGEVVVTVTQQDVDRAWEEFYGEFHGEDMVQGPIEQGIVVSVDGESWVRLDTSDVFPASFYPNAVAMGPDSLLVTGWSDGGGFLGAEPGLQAWAAITADD